MLRKIKSAIDEGGTEQEVRNYFTRKRIAPQADQECGAEQEVRSVGRLFCCTGVVQGSSLRGSICFVVMSYLHACLGWV